MDRFTQTANKILSESILNEYVSEDEMAGIDIYNPKTSAEREAIDEVLVDNPQLHPDDDFEEIESKVAAKLTTTSDVPVAQVRSLDGFFSDDSSIEDQEGLLTPEQQQAVDIAQSLSTGADKQGMLGANPQKQLNKAYGQKMTEIANKINSIKIK
jgi:hypothetical protein